MSSLHGVITGGTVKWSVCGGYCESNGEESRNVVEIRGTSTFSSTSTVLYGGHSEGGGSSTGNKLKVGTIGIEVLGIKKFQEYEFFNLVKDGRAMVKVEEEVDLTGAQVRRVSGRLEGGMRVDRYGNNFESKDMGIGEKEGKEEKYESKGDKYVGGVIGVGYKIEAEDKKKGIEVRCDIEVSEVREEEVELKTGEEVKFGRMEIGKVRSECRVWREIEKYGRDVCKYKIKPYVGIGCEYERVEEEAKYGQVDIASSKVRGVSVIGDVGV
jgi:hypothetical protein